MDTFTRNCPKCGVEISHSRRYNRDAAVRAGRLCKSCGAKKAGRPGESNPFYGRTHTPETRKLQSESRLAWEGKRSDEEREEFREKMKEVYAEHHAGKPRLSNYEYNVARYGIEEAGKRRLADSVRKSEASRGELNHQYGKPSPKLSGNGWQGWYDGSFFRSLRELEFMLQNPEAESAESNKWRAQYVGFSGQAQTTVPDFVIESQRMVYECKPERLHNTPLVQLKVTALRQKLTEMGYGFELVDPGVPSYDVLTELINSGRVRLTERTEKRYREWQV